MRKFLILIIALPFLAASCDLTGRVFDLGTGVRGVFKSEDAGVTFTAANKLAKKGDIGSLSINSLVFDPSNPDTLYAAANAGIYKSEDVAKSWRYILSGISVAALAADHFSPQTVYASGIASGKGKIIKTIDGGTSWVDIYTEPSKNNTVLSIAISRASSSLILAGLSTGEIVRSSDSGRTWQAVKNLSDKIIDIQFGPTDTIYALASRTGLYKSTDAGITWTKITDSLSGQNLVPSNQATSSVTAFYNLALDLKQAGVLYLGTEQGLFRTVNDGTNWAFIALPVKNAALRVSATAVDPGNSNTIYAGIDSTMYKSINGGLTWGTKVLPTSVVVHVILINPSSPNIIYIGTRSQ